MKWILALSALGGILLDILVIGHIPDMVTLIEEEAPALAIIGASVVVVEKLTGEDLP